MYRFVLASASPRRKEILKQAGVSFTIAVCEAEEKTEKKKPEEVVMDLAEAKAKEAAKSMGENAVIIGADTIVADGERIYGKPRDREDAIDMLLRLQGRSHKVYTGVALLIKDSRAEVRKRIFYEETKVSLSKMTREQIEAYADTGEPYDKAGAYGIQGKFAVHISRIEGDYYNVVGLPLHTLYQTLMEEGIPLLASGECAEASAELPIIKIK